MATGKKLPSGSWRCQVFSHYEETKQSDGTTKKKRVYKSFTSDDPSPKGKRLVEQEAAIFAAEKDTHAKKCNITFEDALARYIETKDPVLSPATTRGYRVISHTLNTEFPWFCKKIIDNISQSDIQKLINQDSASRTPKTVRNHHGIISAVLKMFRPNFALNTTLPQKVQPNLYIPSDADIKRLMAAVKDTELEIPVMLGAFGTMRRGEICALTVNDIDGDLIHVHQAVFEDSQGRLGLKAPKTTSSDRYVDVPDFVINKIRQKGYITKLKPHSITIMFDRALRQNNIPHFRFHDLRHYSASVQHALGIPDAYIMKRGGWSSDSVLKSVYRHALSDREKEMNTIANTHFAGMMQHEMQHKNNIP